MSQETKQPTGAYIRPESRHRHVLGSDEFPFEGGRYILYVALACPWANRALTVLRLRQLDKLVDVCIVHPTWQLTDPEKDRAILAEGRRAGVALSGGYASGDPHAGWVFRAPGEPVVPVCGVGSVATANCTEDKSGHGFRTLRQLYEFCGDTLENGGRFTTPLIWDKKSNTIVNNESADIIAQLNGWPMDGAPDLYPEPLREEVDRVNEFTYGINNGVYRCGFARSQEAYDEAAAQLEERLCVVEKDLEGKAYLVGNKLTVADIRLYMTLVRFDEVYVVYFKCWFGSILRRFPNLLRHTARLYQKYPAIRETTFMQDIQQHYFTSHAVLGPFAVIPKQVGFEKIIAELDLEK